MHLRELWRLKRALALVVVLSFLVALWSVEKLSLFPPGMSPRALEMGSGSTHVLIDTPRSTAVDARSNALALVSLTDRANLLGNVMASPPVRAFIARRAGVSPDRIQTVAPLTPDNPRPLPEPGNEKKTGDILRSTDQYRLEIQAQPTAPVLDIYTQAPNAAAAARLANGAVDGLRDYLAAIARTQGISPNDRVRLVQLGRARSGVINNGVHVEAALLSFVLVFAASSVAVLVLARVRRGWQAAAASERLGDDWPEIDDAEAPLDAAGRQPAVASAPHA